MNAPLMAGLLAMGAMTASQTLFKPKLQAPPLNPRDCNSQYCPPIHQVWVDRPINTVMKDQSLQAGLGVSPTDPTLGLIHRKVLEDYAAEARSHPGVRMLLAV